VPIARVIYLEPDIPHGGTPPAEASAGAPKQAGPSAEAAH
jgi:hypothetical protein